MALRQVWVAWSRPRSTRPSTTRRSPPARPRTVSGTPAASALAATVVDAAGGHAGDHPRRGLGEEPGVTALEGGDLESDAGGHGHLGQGQAEASVGDVVDAGQQVVGHEGADEGAHPAVGVEVEGGQLAAPVAGGHVGPAGAGQIGAVAAGSPRRRWCSPRRARRAGRRRRAPVGAAQHRQRRAHQHRRHQQHRERADEAAAVSTAQRIGGGRRQRTIDAVSQRRAAPASPAPTRRCRLRAPRRPSGDGRAAPVARPGCCPARGRP